MTTKRFTLFAFVMAAFVFLVGCKKEKTESEANAPQTSVCGMLHFNSTREFLETQEKILAMNEVERRDWERQQGFKSYATKCEELFEELEAKGINSDEDIYDFVKENPDYFYIREEEGEKYLTSYLEYSSYYQFVDENKMLQIGENVIKVFNEGVVIAPVDQEERLLNITSFYEPTQENFAYYENALSESQSVFKDDNECNCTPIEVIARGTNGNNRTYVRFYRDGLYDDYGFGIITYYMKIRPYKRTLGVWYWCNRTIHYNVEYVISDILGGTKFGRLYGNYEGSCVNRDFYTMDWYIYRALFLQLSGHASTPDARCNVSCWVN